MKVYRQDEVIESIRTRLIPKELCDDIDAAVWMMLKGANTIDIVQCEDCKHQRIDQVNDRLGIRVCDMYEHTTTSDFFCACGERREDAT